MASRNTFLHRMADSLGPVTAGTVVLVILGTLGAPILSLWVRLTDVFRLAAFLPDEIWNGQVWRFVTYPWIVTGNPVANQILNILFSIWALVIFMRAVESSWGPRLLLMRMAILILGPAMVVALLWKIAPHIKGDLGPQALITAIIVAYACEYRDSSLQFLLVPIRLSGDTLIAFEGVMIAVLIILNGTILPFILPLVSYFWAVGWFRLGIGRDSGRSLRRAWLRFRKGRLEARMARMRKRSNLRVVSSRDDEEEPKRYLH